MRDKRVLIVGAGIVGLSTAYALLTRGHSVTVVEADNQPDGCSYGNGGIIVPSHFVPLAAPEMVLAGAKMMLNRKSPFGISQPWNIEVASWVARFLRSATRRHVSDSSQLLRDLNLASRNSYEELIEAIGADCGFTKNGLLMLCRTQSAFAGECRLAQEAKRLGLTATIMSAQDVAQVEPDCEINCAGAVHFEDDAHLTPPALMGALRSFLDQHGVHFIQNTRIDRLKAANGKIAAVESGEESFEADEFVIAAGAWSSLLTNPVGVYLPQLAGKGYGFTVDTSACKPRVPAILVEARIAVTPMLDGVRFVGTMELGRCESLSECFNQHRVGGMTHSIPAYYPQLSSSNPKLMWQGLRPCTPDGLPVIGRPQGIDNLTLATGHAMMGMSLGPITGELVAQIIDGVQPKIPIQALSPNRF